MKILVQWHHMHGKKRLNIKIKDFISQHYLSIRAGELRWWLSASISSVINQVFRVWVRSSMYHNYLGVCEWFIWWKILNGKRKYNQKKLISNPIQIQLYKKIRQPKMKIKNFIMEIKAFSCLCCWICVNMWEDACQLDHSRYEMKIHNWKTLWTVVICYQFLQKC